MSVLLLRLSGPMQAWGDSSRFVRRTTRKEPTKSGVVGLLAAALGRSREESVEDLAMLEFGVRADQPGRMMSDFQTERSLDGKKTMPLSTRYYLADAKFLVALAGDGDFLSQLDVALRSPAWPLFLGRRSCPTDGPISLGVHEEYSDVRTALAQHPWIVSERYARSHAEEKLEVSCDARDGEPCLSQADFPLSFSGAGRRYANRPVYRYHIDIPGANAQEGSDGKAVANGSDGVREDIRGMFDGHDPLGFF